MAKLVGTHVRRIEDSPLLRGQGEFIADLALPGCLYSAFARSPYAHAVIGHIDVEAARRAPGVIDVITPADLALKPFPAPPTMHPLMHRPVLPTDRARYVGEPIVGVVAETPGTAADAVELIDITYRPLPAVIDPEESLRDAQLVVEWAGTNLSFDTRDELPADFFDGCEVIVEARLVNCRMAPMPLEPRVGAAWWNGGKLTVWASCQRAHPVRDLICEIHGYDVNDVRTIVPDVGGAFGAKHAGTPEEILLPLMSQRSRRPVKFIETRSENLVSLNHGRGQIQYCKLGGRRDGSLLAYSMFVIRDAGAFPAIGSTTRMTRVLTPGCYAIPKVSYSVAAPLTNTPPTGSFRGAGRPEAAAAIERMVELFANEIGMAPDAVRQRNFVREFPHANGMGVNYDSGDYPEALRRALDAAGEPALRAEQARRRAANERVLLGIGLSSYVEIANPLGSGEYGSIEVGPDGALFIRSGSSPHGQGLHTALAMLAADETGVPLDRITVTHGDTAVVPRGNGTGGSRSLQTGGSAIHVAAQQLVERARELAAQRLEAAPGDIVLDRERAVFHVQGTPARTCTWADVVATNEGVLRVEHDFVPQSSTFPFGTHLAVVDVDTETGQVTLQRFIAVDDCGVVVNPLLVEGQVHGGIASGVAQALYEEIRYDSDGNPLTTTLADYGCISAAELPSFEVIEMATPTPANPLGAKGVGESGTTGATPAVQNAVIDALSHLGVTHIDLPLTAEKVWRAISSAR